jgi:hypothetical protein
LGGGAMTGWFGGLIAGSLVGAGGAVVIAYVSDLPDVTAPFHDA